VASLITFPEFYIMKLDIIWITPDRFDLKPDKSTWIEMARAMKEYGHHVKVLTSISEKDAGVVDEYSDALIAVNALDLPYVFRLSVLLKILIWTIKNSSKKSIIIINQDSLLLVPFLKLFRKTNIHLDIRTLPVDTHTFKDHLDKLLFWTIPLKFFGRSVRGYSFITKRLRDEIENEFHLGVKEFVIWQSGVSTDIFYPKKTDKINENMPYRIFYHGTVSINRGIGLVIEAMAMLHKEVNVEFIIVGTGSGLDELKKLTNSLDLNQKIIFKGFMAYKEMVNEISLADICVCPLTDRLEWNVSSPIKVFEYMACGKPMILTPISAHKDVLQGADYVVWTHGIEPGSFKEAILDAYNRKEELSNNAESATKFVKENYEWRHQAKKLGDYLTENMNGNR